MFECGLKIGEMDFFFEIYRAFVFPSCGRDISYNRTERWVRNCVYKGVKFGGTSTLVHPGQRLLFTSFMFM